MANTSPTTGRLKWTGRFALGLLAIVAILGVVEIILRQKTLTKNVITDVVDIRTPATFAAKVRHLASQPGKKIVLLGDSLVAGQTMRDYGDSNWRQNTISADIQRRFDAVEPKNASVMNLAMNGVLPADLESMVDGLLLTKPEFMVINVSLRSFSRDFAAPEAQNSRDWLKAGVKFRPDGSILRLPNQYGPASSIERLLLNRWTTYRLRDLLRARFMEGEPKDLLQRLRAGIASKNTAAPQSGPAAEMRLLLQVRGRYANATLDDANPQYAAWTRMLEKLKAANQKTIIFYGTESPRLLPGLIDPALHAKLTDQLKLSVTRHGDIFRYIDPNQGLKDDVFLDHVHVNAAGSKIYGENIFAAMTMPEKKRTSFGQSLNLKFTPFFEQVAAERTELGRITDFSTAASPVDNAANPRFDLQGFPVLSVETRSTSPNRDIMFLYHWWDKNGVPMGVRDSYHMLRASVVPKENYPEEIRNALSASGEPAEYIDVFSGIPARFGATRTAFFLQDSSMGAMRGNTEKSLTLYGQSIHRDAGVAPLDVTTRTIEHQSASSTPDLTKIVQFPSAEGTDISGRGVQFEVTNVAAVFTLKANHDLVSHVKSEELLLGSMLPQVIGYRTEEEEFRTLSFSNADLIKINFDADARKMNIEVYAYEFRERSTRGSMSFPNKENRRIHPNLGLVSKLPEQSITISHSRSDKLSFPLWQPNGAMAAFAVTEHADFVGIAQDTLTMYGSSEAKIVEGQGFLGNRIPLTKTIFPAGQPVPFAARTASTDVAGNFIQATVEGDPNFIKTLRDFRNAGFNVEIGIHCVGTSTISSMRRTAYVKKAIASVAEFKPVTWVDHGGPDCLWESGWDPKSEHYIIPALKEHGFKYVNMLGDKYDGRLNMIADNQPSNLLFYSVGLDDNLKDDWKPFVFNTVPIGFGKSEFTPEHIQQIVRARGLINIHTYLPFESLMFEIQPDGTKLLKANPWYNQLLANIAAAARSGEMHLATTETLNDYMLKVRSLHVYARGSTLYTLNPKRQAISGLTIGYRSMLENGGVEASLDSANSKGKSTRDGANYVWFDLTP
jgi:hypothetical protein